jgi:hypothetical protein
MGSGSILSGFSTTPEFGRSDLADLISDLWQNRRRLRIPSPECRAPSPAKGGALEPRSGLVAQLVRARA